MFLNKNNKRNIHITIVFFVFSRVVRKLSVITWAKKLYMFHWCGRSAGAICYGQKIYRTSTFYFMQFHRGYPYLSNFLWMFTDMLLFRNVSHVDLLKRLYCFAVFQTFFYVDDHYILFQQTLWISVCNSSLWHAFSSVIFVTGSIGKFCGNVNKKY